MDKIILASGSPRRCELLRGLNVDFEVIVSDVNEDIYENLSPEDHVMELSLKKAMAVANNYCNSVVIGADTIVVLNDNIIGKPKDENDAYEILKSLSGKTHKVYTGVSVVALCDNKIKSFYSVTEVGFNILPHDDIMLYIATGEPMDKAGAYGIQNFGSLLVKYINGDYFNVVGLPVSSLYELLKTEFEYDILKNKSEVIN